VIPCGVYEEYTNEQQLYFMTVLFHVVPVYWYDAAYDVLQHFALSKYRDTVLMRHILKQLVNKHTTARRNKASYDTIETSTTYSCI
jgi:hypothetical protein